MAPPDPFAHFTPEQKQMFVRAQTELQAMLTPWLAQYAQLFDEQALIYSLMVTIARAAQSAASPIDEKGWQFASATSFHVAKSLNTQAAADAAAKQAIFVQP